jgi:hypothetical protein
MLEPPVIVRMGRGLRKLRPVVAAIGFGVEAKVVVANFWF